MSIPDDKYGNEQWTEEGYVYDLYVNSRNPFEDVYKRQALHHIVSPFLRNNGTSWYVPGTEVT